MQIKEVLLGELEALRKLQTLLDMQFKFIMDKDIFSLEDVVEKIKLSNKNVAEWEVERRKLVKGNSMIDVINLIDDKESEVAYREIKKILHSLKLQKDTNEMLIKQQMGFNNQILNIIKPKRETNTYNSYGTLRR